MGTPSPLWVGAFLVLLPAFGAGLAGAPPGAAFGGSLLGLAAGGAVAVAVSSMVRVPEMAVFPCLRLHTPGSSPSSPSGLERGHR